MISREYSVSYLSFCLVVRVLQAILTKVSVNQQTSRTALASFSRQLQLPHPFQTSPFNFVCLMTQT